MTVKARIDGQLDRVGFTEGQDVKAGQMLARIDPRTLEAQLAQVVAQKAKDQAQLENARVDLQRYTSLIAEDAATKQQVDTQKALVAQLVAAVQTDDAQINYAQVQFGFTTVNAPISGRVGARLVDPGNIVHATDANGLVVINQIDPIAVVFTLPEDAFQDINRALNAVRDRRSSRPTLAKATSCWAKATWYCSTIRSTRRPARLPQRQLSEPPSHALARPVRQRALVAGNAHAGRRPFPPRRPAQPRTAPMRTWSMPTARGAERAGPGRADPGRSWR